MVSFNLLTTCNANERVPVNKQLICHHSNSNYLVTTNCYVNGQCATVQELHTIHSNIQLICNASNVYEVNRLI
jgi:hypothetical protein